MDRSKTSYKVRRKGKKEKIVNATFCKTQAISLFDMLIEKQWSF